jgi:hypothetical protein
LDGRCLSESFDDTLIVLDVFDESLCELVKLVELETFVELDEQDKLEGSLGLYSELRLSVSIKEPVEVVEVLLTLVSGVS